MSGLEALLSSQIIGLSEAIDDEVATLLTAGTGITLTYNDAANTLTIANSGIGGSTGATDNRILRSDGTGGATLQNSAVTIDDSGNISGLGTVACGAITAPSIANGGSATTFASNGNVTMPSSAYVGTANYFGWTNRALLNSTSDGVVRINNWAANALGSLVCGAITASGQVNIAYADTSGADVSMPTLSVRNTSTNSSWVSSQIRVSVGTGYSTYPEVWLEATRNAVWGDVTMVRTVSNHPLDFVTNGIRRARITATGRWLINTTTDDGTNQFQVNGGVSCGSLAASGLVFVGTYTVATLPSASANAGAIAQVTDSSVTSNGSAVSGGGSSRVAVFSNGTTWDVVVA